MLNDLLMLTKFNRNAESERAARSVAVEEAGCECDEREERGRTTATARLGLKRGGEY